MNWLLRTGDFLQAKSSGSAALESAGFARAGLAHAQSGLALKVHRTFIHYQPHGFAVRACALRNGATAMISRQKTAALVGLRQGFLTQKCKSSRRKCVSRILETHSNANPYKIQ